MCVFFVNHEINFSSLNLQLPNLLHFNWKPSPKSDYVDVESVWRACARMGEMCCYGRGFGAWVSVGLRGH